ncbi:MAG TPA: terminase small subunit [Burkholderiales bacterium]
MMKNAKRLTDRQERFVHEYLIDQNASAAAGRAGYSVKTKGTHAAQMMKISAIRQRIAVGLGDLFARIDLNALEVLRRQVQQAYLDPAKLFDARQRAIPLLELDADTRGGLTVAYALRDDGRQVMTVKQTPRHVALAVLQRRLDNFAKLQEEAFAAQEVEEVPRAARGESARGIFGVELKLDAPKEVALGYTPQLTPSANGGMGAADAAMAEAARAVEVRRGGTEGEERLVETRHDPMPTLSLPLKGRRPADEKGVGVGTAFLPAAAPALLPAPVPSSVPALAPAAAPGSVATPTFAQGEDAPPPSPFEPGYDFKKDPDAMYGGRFTAWNRYWKEKREREQAAAEEAAALRNPPANMRIGPGKTVPVRMEPGYNPPWLRNDRPEFAIGAGECWMD